MRGTRGANFVFFAALAIFFIGAIAPILFVLLKAFFSPGISSTFAQVLSGGNRQWVLLKNTLGVSLGASLGSILLGAPLAFLLSRVSFPGRSLFLLVYPLPILIPSYVHTICWIYLLGSSGWASQLLPGLSPFFGDIYGSWGAIWVLILSYYPVVTLLSYVGFVQMDIDLENAARLQAGTIHSLWSVTWKLAQPAILCGGLFVFIFSLSNFGVPSMLRVQVYSMEVLYQFSNLQRTDQAAVFAFPLLFLSLLALMGMQHMEKDPRYVLSSSLKRCTLLGPVRCKWLLSVFVLFLHILSVFLPLCVLLRMAGHWENYLAAISNARQDILISFWSSVSAATITLMIGGILALMVWSVSAREGRWLEKICLLSFAFPAAAAGIGMIVLWNRGSFFEMVYTSLGFLLIAYFCRYVSFAFKPVWMVLQYIDHSFDESAQVSGISWWRRLLTILTPLSRKGLLAGWFLVYLFSITDLDTTLLVHPPGKGTLPVRIFNLLHFGRQEWVGALCIVLIALTLVPYMGAVLWGSKEAHAHFGMPTR